MPYKLLIKYDVEALPAKKFWKSKLLIEGLDWVPIYTKPLPVSAKNWCSNKLEFEIFKVSHEIDNSPTSSIAIQKHGLLIHCEKAYLEKMILMNIDKNKKQEK